MFGEGIDEVLMLSQAGHARLRRRQRTRPRSTRSFYHRNALGSVVRITDMNQAPAVSYRYTPYGEVTITRNGPRSRATPWASTGRTPAGSSTRSAGSTTTGRGCTTRSGGGSCRGIRVGWRRGRTVHLYVLVRTRKSHRPHGVGVRGRGDGCNPMADRWPEPFGGLGWRYADGADLVQPLEGVALGDYPLPQQRARTLPRLHGGGASRVRSSLRHPGFTADRS